MQHHSKRLRVSACTAVAVSFFAFMVRGETSPRIEQLAWLAGTWRHETARMTFEETWKKVGDSLLQGESITISRSDGKTIASEALILAEMGGEIFYIAKPAQNPMPVAFRLVRFEKGSVAFENAEHDFPTTIAYSLNQDGSLDAKVEGLVNDKPKTIHFHFVRTGPARP
jgi:hypothetical protein